MHALKEAVEEQGGAYNLEEGNIRKKGVEKGGVRRGHDSERAVCLVCFRQKLFFFRKKIRTDRHSGYG
jgi:hypothetical protein